MGTRGAIGFRIGGQDKVTYNHFDSYPDVLGKRVLECIRDVHPAKMPPPVFAIKLVPKESTPTKDEIKLYKKFHDAGVSTGSSTEWYSLLRGAQGDLDAYLRKDLCIMVDSAAFLADSLFCEYAYIVNLDDGVLEFYTGFNKKPNGKGRYAKLQTKPDDEYYGVQLMRTWPLVTLHNALRKSPAAGVAKVIAQMNKLAQREAD